MNAQVTGLHHITAIASDPRQNLDFYTRVLGLRFVKKSVNQDDPGTYHLYYGDYAASPGTILTFFPWAGLRRGRPGTGQAYATAFSVPAGSLPFWQERFRKLGVIQQAIEKRFNDEVLPFADPDGLRLELVATSEADARTAAPARDVPAEVAIRGDRGIGVAAPLDGEMDRIGRRGGTVAASRAGGDGAQQEAEPSLDRG